MNRLAAWSTLLLFTLGGMAGHAQSAAPPPPHVPSASAQRSVRYDKLPLSFEPNVGQTSP